MNCVRCYFPLLLLADAPLLSPPSPPFRPPHLHYPVRNTQLRITFDAIDGVTDVKLSEVMSQGVLTEITVMKPKRPEATATLSSCTANNQQNEFRSDKETYACADAFNGITTTSRGWAYSGTVGWANFKLQETSTVGGINILSGVARWTTTLNPTRGELWGAGRITNFKLQLKVNGVYIQPTNVQLTNKPLSLTEVDPNWVPYTNKITRTNPVNSVRYDNQGAYISNVVYDKTSDTDMEVSARCVACACELRALLLPAAAAG